MIPDSVISIETNAFDGCSELKGIVIPVGVISIGDWAFGNCGRLTDIQYKGTVKEWQAIQKEYGWRNGYISDYTVTCTDGTIGAEGNVAYFAQ